METAEIHIVVTPQGFNRAEVLSPKELGRNEQDLAMEAYGQIAFEIYQFRRRVDQILRVTETDEPTEDNQEIRIYS